MFIFLFVKIKDMNYFFVFVFGTVIGSFLNVVICRYNTGVSIAKGRSRCSCCGKKLKWNELIPIVSFIVQKRRCANCGSKISFQYPLVELLTGLIFLSIFLITPNTGYWLLATGYFFTIFSILMVIAVYDLRHQIIPNKLVYAFIALSFFSPIITNYSFRISDYIAGFAFFVFFASFWLFSKGRWMGLGDAKLSLGIGWLLGFFNGLVALMVSFWAGALLSIFLIVYNKKYSLKSRVAFGPFLIFGALVAFLFGSDIINIIL